MRVLLVSMAACAMFASLPSAQTPAATEVARRIQAHYDTVRDFRADFTQTHKGAFLKQTLVERGNIVVKKVNRMRITYTSRPRKEFVADGTTFFGHFIEDKFGTETPLPKAGESSIALLFLAGRGNLLQDFNAAMPATQPEGRWEVTLTPKKPQPEFDTLTLVVERDTYRLTGLSTQDADSGTSTFQFSDLRENTGVADSVFNFQFPPNVTVKK